MAGNALIFFQQAITICAKVAVVLCPIGIIQAKPHLRATGEFVVEGNYIVCSLIHIQGQILSCLKLATLKHTGFGIFRLGGLGGLGGFGGLGGLRGLHRFVRCGPHLIRDSQIVDIHILFAIKTIKGEIEAKNLHIGHGLTGCSQCIHVNGYGHPLVSFKLCNIVVTTTICHMTPIGVLNLKHHQLTLGIHNLNIKGQVLAGHIVALVQLELQVGPTAAIAAQIPGLRRVTSINLGGFCIQRSVYSFIPNCICQQVILICFGLSRFTRSAGLRGFTRLYCSLIGDSQIVDIHTLFAIKTIKGEIEAKNLHIGHGLTGCSQCIHVNGYGHPLVSFKLCNIVVTTTICHMTPIGVLNLKHHQLTLGIHNLNIKGQVLAGHIVALVQLELQVRPTAAMAAQIPGLR